MIPALVLPRFLTGVAILDVASRLWEGRDCPSPRATPKAGYCVCEAMQLED